MQIRWDFDFAVSKKNKHIEVYEFLDIVELLLVPTFWSLTLQYNINESTMYRVPGHKQQ